MFPTIKLNIERWKYNPTFELYVSNMGHIRNKSKADIAPKIMQNGYMVVYANGSINGYLLLHRVVMLTWKPTPEAEHLTVDHKDHNKRNNALSNLEWVTFAENQRRAAEDLIGTTCICGCEFIKNLNFQNGKGRDTTTKPDPNSKTSKKKAKMNEYRNKMKSVKFFEIEPRTSCGEKILGGTKVMIANSEEGFAEFKSFLDSNKSAATFDFPSFMGKIEAILNGQNMTGYSKYMGVGITPIFDGPAAE